MKEHIETVLEALEAIIRRVALVSPYYEAAREAEDALAKIEAEHAESERLRDVYQHGMGEWRAAHGVVVQERDALRVQVKTLERNLLVTRADKEALSTAVRNAINVLTNKFFDLSPDGDLPSAESAGGMLAQCIESVLAEYGDVDAIRWHRQNDALRARVEQLTTTLRELRCETLDMEPDAWGIRCIEDHNSIIDAALAAPEQKEPAQPPAPTLAEPSDTEMLDWLADQYCPGAYNTDPIITAITHGNPADLRATIRSTMPLAALRSRIPEGE